MHSSPLLNINRISGLLVILLFLAMLFFIAPNSNPIHAISCGDLDSYSDPPTLTATANDEGVHLSWTPVDDNRFVRYAVVISRINPSPSSLTDGYLVRINRADTISYIVDNSVPYNGDDVSLVPLEKGQSYYFAVSVEYECGLIKDSNAVSATFPDLDPPTLIKPNLRAGSNEMGVTLDWDEIDHEYFADYHIVAAKNDPEPNYPDTGSLANFDSGNLNYTVNNSIDYTTSDIDKKFKINTSYYFAVTARYVINGIDRYVTSDVFRLNYTGPSGYPTTFLRAPTITEVISTSTGLKLSWGSLADDPRLKNYVITIGTQGMANYPNGGYLEILEPTVTSYTANNSKAYQNGTWGNYLEFDQRYYIAVSAIYENDVINSNSYQLIYQGPLPTITDPRYLTLDVIRGTNGLEATWTRINDNRLIHYYFLLNEGGTNLNYDGQTWYAQVLKPDGMFDRSYTYFTLPTVSNNPSSTIPSIEYGKTYSVKLVGVLHGGITIESNTVQVEYTETVPEIFPPEETNPPPVPENPDEVVNFERTQVTAVDQALTNRLAGYVLLQVENNGEAWYVDPNSRLKYYLRDRDIAFNALKKFGLGITNADLDRIPVGLEDRFTGTDTDGDGLFDKLEEGLGTDINNPDTDGDSYDDKTEVINNYSPLSSPKMPIDNDFANGLKGRIVLQVESLGQAWYINPNDGKRYYMKDGEAAYEIMRFLSLGINNTDLRKINVGDL